MALFLRGKYAGFYKAGTSECVKDSWRFYQTNKNAMQHVCVRRDMESTLGRFWRYTDTRIALSPVDESEPRLGGRVQATEYKFDVRTFTFGKTHYYGVYGEDFLVYAEFDKGMEVNSDETLIKAVEGGEGVLDRHSFKFENNRVHYSRQVSDQKDTEVEHAIEESELAETLDNSWSETFFYGIGNRQM